MSFNPEEGRAEYTASAAQTVFPFAFKIFADTDIKVYQTLLGQTADDAVDIILLTTDYTVTINGDLGGTMTLNNGATLGDAITIVRDLAITRPVEYQTNGDLLATTLNEDQEYQTYLTADQQDKNALHVSLQESSQGVSNTLPSPDALKVIGWNDQANALENFTIGDNDVFINIRNEDSMEALLSVNVNIYSTINIKGYTTANDGGGGIFNYDASIDKSTANTGTIIDPDVSLANQGTGVGLGCWVRQYSGAVNVKWFGAVNDANEALGTGTDSTDSIRISIKYCQETFSALHLDGTFLITEELEVTEAITIFGNGNSTGYANLPQTEITSGLVLKGTANKRIRSRVLHRASNLDPQDAPLSVGLNIQSENVILRDFVVYLWFDRTDTSPTNYGDDWDVGIFNGCRTHLNLINIHILGYFRDSSFRQDVTRAPNLPEFKDLNGVPFARGGVINGADGLRQENCIFYGGHWGVKVQGAKLATGITDPLDRTTDYYDEELGTTVTDSRGGFGNSDYDAVSCSIYGTDHFSRWRKNDPRGDLDTELEVAGGSVSIDGLAGGPTGMISGQRFFTCRIASFEPFRMKLGNVDQVQHYGCKYDTRTSSLNRDTSGVFYDVDNFGASVGDTTGALSYGYASTIPATRNLQFFGLNTIISTTTKINWVVDTTYFDEFGGATRGGVFTAGNLNFWQEIQSDADMTIRAGNIGDTITLREGATKLADFNTTGLTLADALKSYIGNFLTSFPTSSLILASGVGKTWKALHGTTEFLQHNPGQDITYFTTGVIAPTSDNTTDIGTAGLRIKEIFAANATINTSDDRVKTYLNIEEAEKQVAIELKGLMKKFKFNDSIVEKGENDARLHFGTSAQTVKTTFEKHGLVAENYALLCYDEWEESYAEDTTVPAIYSLDEKTIVTPQKVVKGKLLTEAGNRYGIRYEELLCFIISAM